MKPLKYRNLLPFVENYILGIGEVSPYTTKRFLIKDQNYIRVINYSRMKLVPYEMRVRASSKKVFENKAYVYSWSL